MRRTDRGGRRRVGPVRVTEEEEERRGKDKKQAGGKSVEAGKLGGFVRPSVLFYSFYPSELLCDDDGDDQSTV